MTTTPREGLGGVKASLSSALGDGAVITAPEELAAYQADTYWPAPAPNAAGTPLARPDAVIRPRTEEEVATVHGGIVLDLGALDQHDAMNPGKLGL